MSEDRYTIELLGPPTLSRGGEKRRITNRNAVRLLCSLLLAPDFTLSRSAIAAELWPDHDAEKARANLRRLVADTRGLMEGTGVLLQSGEFGQVTLSGGQGHIDLLDWIRAEEPLTSEAAACVGHTSVLTPRQRNQLLERSSEISVRQAEGQTPEKAFKTLHQAIQNHPLSKRVARTLASLALDHQRPEWLDALASYPEHVDLVSDTRLALMARSADALFGRREEVAATLASLAKPNAVVTLTGLWGVGKSTIAREVVRRLGKSPQTLHGFPDVSDSLVEAYVESLRAHSPDETLLWIESAEHFSANARAQLAGLVRLGWSMLLTSRTPTELPGEHVLAIGMLPTARPEDAGVSLLENSLFRASGRQPRSEERPLLQRIAANAEGYPPLLLRLGRAARYTSLETLLKSGGGSASDTYGEEIRRSVDALPIDLQDAFRACLVFRDRFRLEDFRLLFPEHEASLGTLIDQGLISIAPQSSPPLLFIIEPLRRAVSHLCADPVFDSLASERFAAAFDKADHAVWGEESSELIAQIVRLPNTIRALLTHIPTGIRLDLAVKLHQSLWRAVEMPNAVGLMNDVVGSVREREGVSISFDSARLTLEQSRLHIGRANDFISAAQRFVDRYGQDENPRSSLYVGHSLAVALANEERYAEARRTLQSLREVAETLNEPPLVAYQDRGFGHVAFAEGKFEEAILLADASAALFEAFEIPGQALQSRSISAFSLTEMGQGEDEVERILEQARAAADLELEWEAAIRLAGLRKHPGTLDSVQGRLLASGHLRLSIEFWRAKAKLAPFATEPKWQAANLLTAAVPVRFWRLVWKDIFGLNFGAMVPTGTERATWRERTLAGLRRERES